MLLFNLLLFFYIKFTTVNVIFCSPLTENQIIEDIKFLSQTNNGIKPSRLRELLLNDLRKSLTVLPEINNSADADLKVSTQNCTCIDYACERFINYGKRLRIQRNCEDYCCRKKFIVKKFAYDEDYENDNGCKISNSESPETLLLPWTVQIFSGKYKNQICLGSLIHPQIVLTTLVCSVSIQNNNQYQIRFKEKITKYQMRYHMRNVTKKITPDNYPDLYDKFGFNTALLVLDKSIELNGDRQKACIAKIPFNNNNKNKIPNQNCFVDSIEKQKNGRYIEVRVPVRIYSNEQCQEMYQKRQQRYFPKVNLCAVAKYEQEFNVTSNGAPLICFTDTQNGYYRYAQYGLMTLPNINRLPFLFTNISYFKNWIDKNINNLELI